MATDRRLGPLKTKETETEKERNLRHDTHFLHQLQQASAALDTDEKVRYKEPDPYWVKKGKQDLRFSLSYYDEIEDRKSYIQIGVGLTTTTGLFNTGNAVLDFFSFYPHRRNPDDEYQSDFLYNSALFIYRRPWFGDKSPRSCLKPFKQTWWQRFVKVCNDLGRSSTSPLRYPKHTDQNPKVEEALIAAVFKAIETTGRQDRAKAIIRIQL